MENLQQPVAANAPITLITPLLQNLKGILLEEQEHLASGRVDRLEMFARKKMQALAQINVYASNDPTNEMAKANAIELKEIDSLLRDNMKRLNFRIDAIGEITETIRVAVKEAESDGTYKAGSYFIKKRK